MRQLQQRVERDAARLAFVGALVHDVADDEHLAQHQGEPRRAPQLFAGPSHHAAPPVDGREQLRELELEREGGEALVEARLEPRDGVHELLGGPEVLLRVAPEPLELAQLWGRRDELPQRVQLVGVERQRAPAVSAVVLAQNGFAQRAVPKIVVVLLSWVSSESHFELNKSNMFK